MKGYVYLIENKINGNKYVGKTYLSVDQRWKEHIKESKKERNSSRPLYNAINKYGIENFTITEIEYCENCEEREKYWISFYNSYKNGYNATLGGDGKTYFEHSDQEVIEKYKELKFVDATAKFFNCNKDTIRKRLNNNGIIINHEIDILNKNRSWQTRSINQYSLKGEFIQSFLSLTKAANWILENNYSKGKVSHIVSNISKTAKGIENRKKAYNFIWKFPE